MDELTREFLLESYENLDHLDQEFVKLETEPANLELLKSIFRTIHTIKGTCCQGRGRGAGGTKHLARSHRFAESGEKPGANVHAPARARGALQVGRKARCRAEA
jgi:hypothetical protein